MRVLIAGGGIGGLTTALSLHDAGIEAVVYESVPVLRELGVGINLLPHAVRALSALALQPALASTAIETREIAYYTKHGRLIWRELRGLGAGYQWPQYSIHRGRLLMIRARGAGAPGRVFHSGRASPRACRAGRRRRDGAFRRSRDRRLRWQRARRCVDRPGRHSLDASRCALSGRGAAEIFRHHDVAWKHRTGPLPRWADDGHRRQLAYQGGGLSDLSGSRGARPISDQLGGRDPRREQDGLALGRLGSAGQEGRLRSGLPRLAVRLAGRAPPATIRSSNSRRFPTPACRRRSARTSRTIRIAPAA